MTADEQSSFLEGTVTVGEYTFDYLERSGSPDTIPLVFAHGFLDSKKAWTKVLSDITPGSRLLALSLRGWGDSSKSGPYTVDAYAEDVVAFMDALGIDKAVYCGHSMGTLIGTLLATRYPDRIQTLVLCSAADRVRPDEFIFAEGDNISTTKDLFDPTGLGIVAGACASCGELAENAKAALCEFQECDDRSAVTMVETFKADPGAVNDCWVHLLEEDHTAVLGNVTCPVLILWGEDDLLFQKVVQDRLIVALINAATQFVSVPEATHDSLIGDPTAAATVATQINEFLHT